MNATQYMEFVMQKTGYAALALAALLASCADAEHMAATGTPTPASATPAAALPSLDRTRWSLVDSRLAAASPEDKDRVRLEFTTDRLSANSGCNLGNGGYRIENRVLILSPMAATKRACVGPGADYETAFFAFLDSRPTVRLDKNGDELVLESQGAEQRSLRFRSVPMPSANAVQKFIYVAAERAPCTGVAPKQCLQVRNTPEEPWQLHHDEIIGFDPEPGIEYRLRILEDNVPNPPADGSSKRWFLDMVVEQRVVKP